MNICWKLKKPQTSSRRSFRSTTNPRLHQSQTGAQAPRQVLFSKRAHSKHSPAVTRPSLANQSAPRGGGHLCRTEPSQVSCPLEDPALPLVSEVDHRVGYCFCHLCCCGQHKCPAKKYHPLQAQPAASCYTISYQPKPGTDLLREVNCAPLQYRSLRPNQELKSSYQAEFQPVSSSRCPQPVPDLPSMKSLDFAGRNSLYKREYPGWNVDEVVQFKAPVQQQCLGLFDPAMISSYQVAYRPHSIKAILSKGTKSHRLVKEKFTGKTTNQASYQDRSAEGFTMNPHEHLPERPVGKVHAKPFASVYKGDFQGLTAKWFPRSKGVRKSLG